MEHNFKYEPAICLYYRFDRIKRGNLRGIRLVLLQSPKKAHIAVYNNGEIKDIRDATPSQGFSFPYTKYEERSHAHFFWMNIDGLVYSISFAKIYEMAFNADKMPQKGIKEIKAYAKFKENKSNGIKPKW